MMTIELMMSTQKGESPVGNEELISICTVLQIMIK